MSQWRIFSMNLWCCFSSFQALGALYSPLHSILLSLCSSILRKIKYNSICHFQRTLLYSFAWSILVCNLLSNLFACGTQFFFLCYMQINPFFKQRSSRVKYVQLVHESRNVLWSLIYYSKILTEHIYHSYRSIMRRWYFWIGPRIWCCLEIWDILDELSYLWILVLSRESLSFSTY